MRGLGSIPIRGNILILDLLFSHSKIRMPVLLPVPCVCVPFLGDDDDDNKMSVFFLPNNSIFNPFSTIVLSCYCPCRLVCCNINKILFFIGPVVVIV